MPTLEEVLQNFEKRLAALEAKAGISPIASPPAASPAPVPAAPAQQARPAVAGNPSSSTGSFFGLVGIAFLILAAVFFLKLTIEAGWLTPLRQVSLAAFFGLGCLLLPHLSKPLHDAYGAILSGAGAAILHLTWLGAYLVHELVGHETALVLATTVGVLSILLSARLGNAVFLLVAVAGTYLAAPLIGHRLADGTSLASFFLIWNVSFSALAYGLARRDLLLIAATFAALTLGTLTLGARPLDEIAAWSFLAQQLLQLAVFACALLAHSIFHRDPLKGEQSWLLALLLLLHYALLHSLVGAIQPALAPWVGVAFALLVLLLSQLARRALARELPSTPAVVAFVSMALLHSLYLKITPEEAKPLLSLALGLGLAAFGKQLSASPAWRPAYLAATAVALYGALLTFTGDLPHRLLLAYQFTYGLSALVVVLALTRVGGQATLGRILLGFAHLEMLSALYRLSLEVEMSGSLFVSLAWGGYALLVLLWGARQRSRLVGQSAVLILAAVSIKAAFYDVLQTGHLARVASLLVAGVLLYGCGWVFQKMRGWEE